MLTPFWTPSFIFQPWVSGQTSHWFVYYCALWHFTFCQFSSFCPPLSALISIADCSTSDRADFMREPWSYCFPQLSLLCRPALFLKLYMAKTKIITRETSGTHDILATGWVAELSHSDTSFSSVITFKWSESLSSQSHSGAGGTGWWGARRPITPGQQVGTSGTSGVSRDINGDH